MKLGTRNYTFPRDNDLGTMKHCAITCRSERCRYSVGGIAESTGLSLSATFRNLSTQTAALIIELRHIDRRRIGLIMHAVLILAIELHTPMLLMN